LALARPEALDALTDSLYDALTETLVDAEKREPEFTGI
jgi:enoyl-CoA hydratase/carnithine racemase